MLTQWQNLLNNRMLFAPEPFDDVDAVTGATVSSDAILAALEISGHKLSTQILGHTSQTGIKKMSAMHSYLPDATGAYLIIIVIFSIVVIYFGGFWVRLVVLCLNLIVGGIILNAQYSIEQIATILSLHAPAVGLSGAFVLVVGIPLLVIIFGNVYCGYICPFGAMQELLGFIVPQKYKPAIPAEKMQKARFVKYIILFVLLMVFFLSRNRTTLTSEPLISIFNLRLSILDFNLIIFLISAAALVGSAFYTRFWCRYLCPVGAFLSLFNNVLLLKKYLPAKKYGKCEFGLTSTDKMDCLYCDKCRYEKIKSRKTQKTAKVFLPYILMIAVFISAVSISRFLQVVPAGFDRVAISAAAGGQPRDVDIQRVRKMIQQKKLSDKEALFYKTVGTEDPI
jgi:hypothetical protein